MQVPWIQMYHSAPFCEQNPSFSVKGSLYSLYMNMNSCQLQFMATFLSMSSNVCEPSCTSLEVMPNVMPPSIWCLMKCIWWGPEIVVPLQLHVSCNRHMEHMMVLFTEMDGWSYCVHMKNLVDHYIIKVHKSYWREVGENGHFLKKTIKHCADYHAN